MACSERLHGSLLVLLSFLYIAYSIQIVILCEPNHPMLLEEGWEPLTSLTLPHICACPKPGFGFPMPYVLILFCVCLLNLRLEVTGESFFFTSFYSTTIFALVFRTLLNFLALKIYQVHFFGQVLHFLIHVYENIYENRLFEHSRFDSKILSFYSFFIQVFSLMMGKMVPDLTRAIDRTTNLSIIFS